MKQGSTLRLGPVPKAGGPPLFNLKFETLFYGTTKGENHADKENTIYSIGIRDN
jgi:hypothetical protein